jgi:hypothetical protein
VTDGEYAAMHWDQLTIPNPSPYQPFLKSHLPQLPPRQDSVLPLRQLTKHRRRPFRMCNALPIWKRGNALHLVVDLGLRARCNAFRI